MKIIPTILSTALLGALTTPVAHASQTPYMWGIGPTVNTIVLPGNHPFEFPDVVKSAGFKTTGGDVGFGYDAIFAPDEADGLTFAEMASTAKNVISHRGRAFAALLSALEQR